MAGQKRALEDNSSRNVKKSKLAKDKSKDVSENPVQFMSIANEEIDFPRGGGTSLTAAEVKAIQAEATQEADNELFAVSSSMLLKVSSVEYNLPQASGKSQKKKSKSSTKSKAGLTPKKDVVRIEHLNYKVLSSHTVEIYALNHAFSAHCSGHEGPWPNRVDTTPGSHYIPTEPTHGPCSHHTSYISVDKSSRINA